MSNKASFVSAHTGVCPVPPGGVCGGGGGGIDNTVPGGKGPMTPPGGVGGGGGGIDNPSVMCTSFWCACCA